MSVAPKSEAEYLVEDRGHLSPCWVWQRAVGLGGYGNAYRDGKQRNMHRWFYERALGPIPEGMQLDHLCRVRACVNPAHLEPVTNRENSHRGNKCKLTTAEVEQIRKATGPIVDIARRFGISATYAGQIRLGRRRAAV